MKEIDLTEAEREALRAVRDGVDPMGWRKDNRGEQRALTEVVDDRAVVEAMERGEDQ